MKSMSNALGKTGRCLVGVVLFARLARLDFPVFAGSNASFEAATGTSARQTETCEYESKSRPMFAKQSGSFDQLHRVYGVRVLCLFPLLFLFFSFFFFFSFLHF